MGNKLARLVELKHRMPEDCVDKALEQMSELVEGSIKEEAEKEPAPPCPHCKAESVRNGRKNGRQRFICKACARSFGLTTNAATSHSHFGQAVWKQEIRDTIDGVSLDETAGSLLMSHSTAFNAKLLMFSRTADRPASIISTPQTVSIAS